MVICKLALCRDDKVYASYNAIYIAELNPGKCLWNTDAPPPPRGNKSKYGNSYILTLFHPQGHVMLVSCEQPLDELTVQIQLLHDHPYFEYCT